MSLSFLSLRIRAERRASYCCPGGPFPGDSLPVVCCLCWFGPLRASRGAAGGHPHLCPCLCSPWLVPICFLCFAAGLCICSPLPTACRLWAGWPWSHPVGGRGGCCRRQELKGLWRAQSSWRGLRLRFASDVSASGGESPATFSCKGQDTGKLGTVGGKAMIHAHSTHVPSHMHTACTKPTWRTAHTPGLGKGSTPCTVPELYWLALLLHLCHKTLRPWSSGLHRPHFLPILRLRGRWHYHSLAHPSCPVSAVPADPVPVFLTGMLSHPPIPISDMAEHMDRLKANDSLQLSQEYEVS